MLNKIKQHKFIIIAGVVIMILILVVFNLIMVSTRESGTDTGLTEEYITVRPIQQITSTPVPERQTKLDAIKPGTSNKNEVIQALGQPAATTPTGGNEVILYKIPATNRQNAVYLKNNTVEYVSEEIPVDNALYTDYTEKEGPVKPDGKLYDYNYSAGFVWHVFAVKGIAFLANPMNGYTIKVLYFPQMSYEQFLKKVAADFSLKTEAKVNTEGFR